MRQSRRVHTTQANNPFQEIERIYQQFEQKIGQLRRTRDQQLATIIAKLDAARAAALTKEIHHHS